MNQKRFDVFYYNILNVDVCILHSTNTLSWGGELNYSPTSYELIVGQTGFFNFGMATGLGEGKHCIQIDCCSCVAFCPWRRGWLNIPFSAT